MADVEEKDRLAAADEFIDALLPLVGHGRDVVVVGVEREGLAVLQDEGAAAVGFQQRCGSGVGGRDEGEQEGEEEGEGRYKMCR